MPLINANCRFLKLTYVIMACALLLLGHHLGASSATVAPKLGKSSINITPLAPVLALPATVKMSDDAQFLSVTTADQYWHIQLETKRLLGGLAEVQKTEFNVPTFYNGHIIGDSSSWARITRESPATHDSTVHETANTLFSGSVFTNGVLYQLEYQQPKGEHVIRALNEPAMNQPLTPLPVLTPRAVDESAQALHAIKIGIVIDSRYNEYHNGRGLAHALGIINGVDGLYQEQLGLAVVVEKFRVYDNPVTDPLRNSDSAVDQVLNSLRDLRLNDAELPADLALVHLFSGHGDPEKVIGLGWISTACRVDGYDLSLSTPFPYDVLLAAHEIAHNLGAPHDNDAQCRTDNTITGFEVMWSELSGNTQPNFSACSLNEMQAILGASCVADNIDIGIALAAQSTVNDFEQHVQLSVVNNDLSRIARGTRSITTFPTNTTLYGQSAGCTINQSTMSCEHPSLDPGQSTEVSVTATFAHISNPVVSTEISSDIFTDTHQQNNRATVQADVGEVDTPSADQPTLTAAAGVPTNNQRPAIAQGGSAGAGTLSTFSLLIVSLWSGILMQRRKSKPLTYQN